MPKSYMLTRDTFYFNEGEIVYEAVDSKYTTGLSELGACMEVCEAAGSEFSYQVPTSALEEITGLD